MKPLLILLVWSGMASCLTLPKPNDYWIYNIAAIGIDAANCAVPSGLNQRIECIDTFHNNGQAGVLLHCGGFCYYDTLFLGTPKFDEWWPYGIFQYYGTNDTTFSMDFNNMQLTLRRYSTPSSLEYLSHRVDIAIDSIGLLYSMKHYWSGGNTNCWDTVRLVEHNGISYGPLLALIENSNLTAVHQNAFPAKRNPMRTLKPGSLRAFDLKGTKMPMANAADLWNGLVLWRDDVGRITKHVLSGR
jgi:hypothetical protein